MNQNLTCNAMWTATGLSMLISAIAFSSGMCQNQAVHATRQLTCWVDISGYFGATGFGPDPKTGAHIRGSEYPRGVLSSTPEIAPMLVALIDSDTCIIPYWNADRSVYSDIQVRSFNPRSTLYQSSARAAIEIETAIRPLLPEQAPIIPAPYSGVDIVNNAVPLQLRQVSRSWDTQRTDDFILVTSTLQNQSSRYLRKVFLGYRRTFGFGDLRTWSDDSIITYSPIRSTGSVQVSLSTCDISPNTTVSYSMATSGISHPESFPPAFFRSAFGLGVLRRPDQSDRTSFNWFAATPQLDWGPARLVPDGSYGNSFSGSPRSATEIYQLFETSTIDYPQIFTRVNFTSTGWKLPPTGAVADTISVGETTASALHAFGPFDLGPGESVEWVIALVGGDSVHTDPTAYERLFDPLNPYPFYNQLNFQPLIENARWASWVYDNPGIDTDGDGYRGEFEICNADPESGFIGDTLWYTGDGIPDYRADLPPPAPPTRVYTSEGKLVIRWNGYDVEKTFDPFTRKMDFQGYKVYLGRDPRREDISLYSQWDKEDYIALKFTLRADGKGDWLPVTEPMSLDSITDLFDLTEHPLNFTRQRFHRFNNESYYFEKQDNNVSDLTDLRGVHKAYPDALPPLSTDSLLWTDDEITTEHGRKFPKYSEYEYIIDNLLPSVPWYVSVTAFDHGFVLGGMPPQESDPIASIQEALALTSADSVEAQELDVFVYPNPYRSNADYIERGYENRDNSQPDQKAGRIHFVNLPNECKISIYSLDGDHIWSYDHNPGTFAANDMHAEWDLISRNRQLVVSGLYYWVVESKTRTQIGKLVILR